jgi:hypothetical protein
VKKFSSSKLLFLISVLAGVAVWAVFAAFGIEPWDSLYGWIAVGGAGLVLGLLGKGNPLLWPLGIFLGQALFGLGGFVQSLFFYSGGGANLFLPLGLLFLVPFTIPALVGSLVGFGLRWALTKTLSARPQNPRPG